MGAIGIGLASAGYKVLRAYDSWGAAADMYNHNAPHPVAMTCDILTLEGWNQIKRDAREVGEVDLLAA